MLEIEPNEKNLDEVLRFLRDSKTGYESYDTLLEKFKTSFSPLLNLEMILRGDGYTEDPISPKQGITISGKGKIFIKNGGYIEKKLKEDRIYSAVIDTEELAKKTFCWTKANTFWVIVSAMLALIAILISAFDK